MAFLKVEQRESVVRIARSWLGTPYEHMQRVKGCGADCAMFPLAVYQEAGLLPDVKIDYYPMDWHLHRSDERYLEFVQRFAHEVETPLPGDFVLYRFGRCFSHGAIVIAWPLVIHSMMGKGVLLADGEREGQLVGRERRSFSFCFTAQTQRHREESGHMAIAPTGD